MPERASRARAAAPAPAPKAAPAAEPELGLLPAAARRRPATVLPVSEVSVETGGPDGAHLHLTLERDADQPLAGLEGRLRVRGGALLAHGDFRILSVTGRECAVTIAVRDGLAADILRHFAEGMLEAELRSASAPRPSRAP